jgi:type IV secretory pathway TrbD component
MVYDDLHLIRPFTNEEILSSFHGDWDPDHIETPGLRPLTLLFNHARYKIFGENVILHRVFLIVLYAGFLTLICWIAYLVGVDWKLAILAGALSLMAKYNTYHYVWISDGIHLFQGCLVGISILCLLLWLKGGCKLYLLLTLAITIAGMLAREDTLAIIPISILIGYVYLRSIHHQSSLRLLYVYSGFIVAISISFLLYRRFAVPEAQPPEVHPVGLLLNVMLSLSPFGLGYFDTPSRIFVTGWLVGLTMLIAIRIIRRQSVLPAPSIVWLLCAISASSSGLTLSRVNLLLFSLTFSMLFLGSLFWETMKRSRWRMYLTVTVVLCAFAGSYYIDTATTQAFQPQSLLAISWNSELVYGRYAHQATIPNERKQEIAAQLATVGIFSVSDIQRLPHMIAAALKNDEPQDSALLKYFLPQVPPFQP